MGGNSFTLSVHTCGGGEVTRPGPASRGDPTGGGVPNLGYLPSWTWLGGTPWGAHLGHPPCWTWPGGAPPWVPPVRPGRRGYTDWGVPHLTYLPPSDLAGGYPEGGIPPRVSPPHQTWPGGGTPTRGGTPPQITDGVLDTPRSVCLLRSRRMTFLF